MIPRYRAWDKISNRMWNNVVQLKFERGVLYSCEVTNNQELSYKTLYQDDFILMQSTGLEDKNSKEIFKDDIVLVTLDTKDASNISKEDCCFITGVVSHKDGVYIINSLKSGYNPFLCNDLIISKETMGNKYQNPELLKEIN